MPRTQVAIVGAGPAGLTLAHLLARAGVESVVLEARSREHVEGRVRAGVVERGVARLLDEAGVGERLRREGLVHTGIRIQVGGVRHRIALDGPTGGGHIVVYGQTELVKDLVAARLALGAPLLFEAEAVAIEDVESARPRVRYRHGGAEHELACDAVAACDGFHGVGRASLPGSPRSFARDYPLAWLGILAAAPPASEELVYAHHERGFALASLRSPERARLYLQCRPDDDLAAWSDERIWAELHARLDCAAGTLVEGPVLERSITGMRSFVVEPMAAGRLFLAGDAAHIVPPTGAKGLNLAVRDAALLAEALTAFYGSGSHALLDRYSDECLRRAWRAERFAAWLTGLLHVHADADPFACRLQLAELEALVRPGAAAAAALAEEYVGLE